MILSAICYVWNGTVVFGCGTFVKPLYQTLVLAGSIIGVVVSLASIVPIVLEKSWPITFFIFFGGVTFVSLLLSELFIKRRIRKDLATLDEYESTGNFEIIGSKNKFRQSVCTGFTYGHKVCLDFSVFKAAAEKWSDDLDVWVIYAKFTALYPEMSSTLQFIGNILKNMAKKNQDAEYYLSNIGQIIKTRETKFTPQLKSKIAKLQKLFDKSKNRLRNIWDLVLQGNTTELDSVIRSTYESIETSELEINELLMLYPNNRFVARQYAKFQPELKSDAIMFRKWNEDIKLLQKGIQIHPDTLHELGFIAFDNIPDHCNESISTPKVATTGTEQNTIGMDEINAYDEDLDYQQIANIKSMIDNNKIPAIQYMYNSTIFAFICIIFVPFLVLLGFFFYLDSTITYPLSLMYGISYMRNLINMLPPMLTKFLMKMIDDPKIPGTKCMTLIELNDDFPMNAFGGSKDSKMIIQFLNMQVADANSIITPLRNFEIGNKYMEKVRDLVFAHSHEFYFYMNNTYREVSIANIGQIAYMVTNHISKVIGLSSFDNTVPKGLDTITAKNNNAGSTESLTEAVENIISYMTDVSTRNHRILIYLRVALIILVFIIYLIIVTTQIRKLRNDKIVIYGLLSSLHKTVISNISYSFTKLQREATATTQSLGSIAEIEHNRQEESIIKLFSSINDEQSKASVEMYNLFNFLFIAVAGIIGFYFIIESYLDASTEVVNNCYHIDYMYGSIAHIYKVMSNVFDLVWEHYDSSFQNICVNETVSLQEIKASLPIVANYFQLLTLGGPNQIPFSGMQESVDDASQTIKCGNILTPPKIIPTSAHCFSAGGQFYLMNMLMRRFYGMMTAENPVYALPKGDGITYTWQIGAIELYEAFFYRTGMNLVSTIKASVNSEFKPLTEYCFIFMIIAAIFSINVLRLTRKEEILLKFTMNCLLKCNSQILLSNSHIIDVLGGNYENVVDETIDRTQSFHNEVVNKLDDIIIVCREENNNVINVNTSFEEMFRIKQEEIENKDVKTFFMDGKFTSDDKIEKVILSGGRLIYTKPTGEKVYLDFSSQYVAGRRIYSGINQTQIVMHEKLIVEEKKKSDAMLASILPPMLVTRVQAGEKNISFAVQSVTVLFLDVVEFTPWCGSHDAQYVMRMLNIMYKEFDVITNAHLTMTKIKCIGDCYMTAGGIFDEINQLAVHAKEVVDFGCKVIKKLEEIDERENEKLRIRVGINTGGPIVAGVIGTEKPTFEILGPAINIAHEMENKGVPMKVHISRPVYELVYGQNFEIKERGEIDVKGGKMFTYLVEP